MDEKQSLTANFSFYADNDVASVEEAAGFSTTDSSGTIINTRQRKTSQEEYRLWVAYSVYASVFVLVGILYAGVFIAQTYNLPLPLNDQDPTVFSELRALQTLESLVNIATNNSNLYCDQTNTCSITGRLTMTESGSRTAAYLTQQLEYLQGNYSENDLIIMNQVAGGVLVDAGTSFALYFDNANNVVAMIPGANGIDSPAVLISTHYDSVGFSPGASDNGAAVAVSLELVRNFLAKRKAGQGLQASIIFLFDDGEEAGLLGAASFIENHPWFGLVKTYINLDSNGGWGRALLTQVGPQTEWLAQVYAKSVPYAEATVTVADIFALLPSGTNYEIFALNDLPGIDIDLYRNDYTYHTSLDKLDGENEYQDGTLQAMGENTMAYLEGVVAASQFTSLPQPITENKVTAVFYDILLGPVLAYRYGTAQILALVAVIISVIMTAYGAFIFNTNNELPFVDRNLNVVINFALVFVSLVLSLVFAFAVTACFGTLLELANPAVYFGHLPIGLFALGMWVFPVIILTQAAAAAILSLLNRPLVHYRYVGPIVPIEVLTVLAVHAIHLALLVMLTAFRIGSAYLLLWWCFSFNVATLFMFVYLYIRKRTEKISGGNFNELLSRMYGAIEPTEDEDELGNKKAVTKYDVAAWVIFYLLWTTFPTLIILDAGYRFILGITPQLGRLGIPNDSLVLGAGVGLLESLFAVCVFLPWIPLVQRMQRRLSWASFFTIGCVVAFLVACFALFPYSAARPRRVDVVHYYEISYTGGANFSSIMLGAPNPGSLQDITNDMENPYGWTACSVVTYGYTYQSGLCIENVTPPNLPIPSFDVLDSRVNGNVWYLDLLVNAPNAAVSVFKFGNASDLIGWSLNASLPVRGAMGGVDGTIFVDNGYAIVRRSTSDNYTVSLQFDAVPSTQTLWCELWSSFYKVTDLQQKVIGDLPEWTQVWAKSNNPGPIAIKIIEQFIQPSYSP